MNFETPITAAPPTTSMTPPNPSKVGAQVRTDRSAVSPARLCLLATTGLVGLAAGFFYTYQISVLRGLALVSDRTFVETFQAINETIRNPAFGIVIAGSVVGLILTNIVHWSSTGRCRLFLCAALVQFVAVLAVTGGGNVPLNDELATYETITSATATEAREAFESDWTRLNMLRTVFVVASFLSLLGALGSSDT